MLRRQVARVVSSAGLLALLVLAPVPAQAHDELSSSAPSADQIVTEVPEALELTFSAPVLDVNPQVVARDSEGREVTTGEVELDGTTVRRALVPDADGDIEVAWSVASSDGHRIEGEYMFTIAPVQPAEPSESASAPAVAPSLSPSPAASQVAAAPGVDADDEGKAEALPLGARLGLAAGATAVVVTLGILALRKARGLDGRDRSTAAAGDA